MHMHFFCSMHDIEGVTMRSKGCVDVCFHAIFSPAMFNNPEMDKVFILFDNALLRNLKKKHQMKVVK